MGIFDKFNQMSLDMEPQKSRGHAIETVRVFTMCTCDECKLIFQPIKRGIRGASEQTICSIPCGKTSLEGMLLFIKKHFNPTAEVESQNGLFSTGDARVADASLAKVIERIERLPKDPDTDVFVPVYIEAKNAYIRIQAALTPEVQTSSGMRP